MPSTETEPDLNPFEANRKAAPVRGQVMNAAVTAEEKARVVQALADAGFTSLSEGIRETMFAFVDSEVIRDAVQLYRTARAAS